MKQQETLHTRRLILRPFRLSDAHAVQKKAGHRSIADTTTNIPHPYGDGIAQQWIKSHKPKHRAGESVVYAITLKRTGELIGSVGLNIDKQHNRAELGYWISVDRWGKGYCTEAAKAVVGHGFTKLRLNKIAATYFKRNPASGRVMEKLGMKKEGCYKEHMMKWGKYEDIYSYGILEKEWKKK